MAKHDLKKLALLGLASGLIITNTVQANSDQQLLSQLNSKGHETFIAKLNNLNQNWNTADQEANSYESRNRVRHAPTDRNTSYESGANAAAQGFHGKNDPNKGRSQNDKVQNANQGRRNSQSQLSIGNETTAPAQERAGSKSSNTKSNSNAAASQLALGDVDAAPGISESNQSTSPNGPVNQPSRGQSIKPTAPSYQRTVNQDGKADATPDNNQTNPIPGQLAYDETSSEKVANRVNQTASSVNKQQTSMSESQTKNTQQRQRSNSAQRNFKRNSNQKQQQPDSQNR